MWSFGCVDLSCFGWLGVVVCGLTLICDLDFYLHVSLLSVGFIFVLWWYFQNVVLGVFELVCQHLHVLRSFRVWKWVCGR